jgi:DNA polymerase-3 subunit gamma/tau
VLCFANALPITVDIVSTALGRTPRHLFQELDQAICSHHLPFAFELSEALFSAGRDPTLFLEELADHFRTHAFAAISAKSPTLYTQEETLYIMDFLMRTLHLAMKTPFKRVGVEMVLLHLIRSKQRIPIESLVKRLTQLEQGAPPQAPESVTTKEIKTAPPAVAKLFEPPSPPTPSLPEEMSTPPPPAPVTPITEQPSSSPRLKQSKHETVMRFAAIELEGTIK